MLLGYTLYDCGFFVFFLDSKFNAKILTRRDRENILKEQLYRYEIAKYTTMIVPCFYTDQ